VSDAAASRAGARAAIQADGNARTTQPRHSGQCVDVVAAGRDVAEIVTVILMAGVIFDSQPTRTLKPDMAVMLERTRDELPAIQQLWPRFEHLAGLRGRRMYAMVDVRAGTYAACTPVREGDDPARLGLEIATLPGGWYLRARITGEPPGLYERIGPAMQALEALAVPADPGRPLIEYYRRHDEIELWVPVREDPRSRSRLGRAGPGHHAPGGCVPPSVLPTVVIGIRPRNAIVGCYA
jgi:hypothetical protein